MLVLVSAFCLQLKRCQKELLPIIDKPLIQYAAEEAIAAGINALIFVTGWNKCSIEDHFDTNNEVETMLRAKGKDAQAEMVSCQRILSLCDLMSF